MHIVFPMRSMGRGITGGFSASSSSAWMKSSSPSSSSTTCFAARAIRETLVLFTGSGSPEVEYAKSTNVLEERVRGIGVSIFESKAAMTSKTLSTCVQSYTAVSSAGLSPEFLQRVVEHLWSQPTRRFIRQWIHLITPTRKPFLSLGVLLHLQS
jgi:hypothetical protein